VHLFSYILSKDNSYPIFYFIRKSLSIVVIRIQKMMKICPKHNTFIQRVHLEGFIYYALKSSLKNRILLLFARFSQLE